MDSPYVWRLSVMVSRHKCVWNLSAPISKAVTKIPWVQNESTITPFNEVGGPQRRLMFNMRGSHTCGEGNHTSDFNCWSWGLVWLCMHRGDKSWKEQVEKGGRELQKEINNNPQLTRYFQIRIQTVSITSSNQFFMQLDYIKPSTGGLVIVVYFWFGFSVQPEPSQIMATLLLRMDAYRSWLLLVNCNMHDTTVWGVYPPPHIPYGIQWTPVPILPG